jgi:hypothetical protein
MMASTSGGSDGNSMRSVTLLVMGEVATLRIGVELTLPGSVESRSCNIETVECVPHRRPRDVDVEEVGAGE